MSVDAGGSRRALAENGEYWREARHRSRSVKFLSHLVPKSIRATARQTVAGGIRGDQVESFIGQSFVGTPAMRNKATQMLDRLKPVVNAFDAGSVSIV
ncbi:hypothetical protein OSJ57_23035 [Sphingomonas sp. HH69]